MAAHNIRFRAVFPAHAPQVLRKQIKILRKEMAYSYIKAPLSGTILEQVLPFGRISNRTRDLSDGSHSRSIVKLPPASAGYSFSKETGGRERWVTKIQHLDSLSGLP